MDIVCEPSLVRVSTRCIQQNSIFNCLKSDNIINKKIEMNYIDHLSRDRKFKKLLENTVPLEIKRRKNIYNYLCASIMSQQLSTKVATVIYNRFLALYGGKEPTPQQIIDTPFDKLRSIGLSNAKANYVQNVARFEIE